MEEEWRPVKGYEGLYEVSNMGRVKSLHRSQSIIMKQHMNHNGYMFLGLRKDGTRSTKLVHRLVATAFIRNPNNYKIVNHKDGNKNNNIVDNLEWCTSSYNSKHAYRIGLMNVDAQKKHVILYKRYGEYESITEAAEDLGVAQSTLSIAIRKNRTIHSFIGVVGKDPRIRRSIPINIYNGRLVFLGQEPSTDAAARFAKISRSTVRRCCREKVFSKGYTFRFFDDDEIHLKEEA